MKLPSADCSSKLPCTHLVLNLVLDAGDVDGLCEGGAVLVEFDRFGPIVESSSYVDFFSRMLPNRSEKKQRSARDLRNSKW